MDSMHHNPRVHVRWVALLAAAVAPSSCALLSDFEGLTSDGAETVDASDAHHEADAVAEDAGSDAADGASESETDGTSGDVLDALDALDADAPAEEPGVPVLIASCAGNAWALALEGDEVFWTSHNVPTGTALGSAVHKASLGCRSGDCGTELAFFSEVAKLSDIAIDKTWVYFGENRAQGRILRVARAGGEPEVLAKEQAYPYGLAADPSYVYWTGEDAQVKGYLRRAFKTAAQVDGGDALAHTLLAGLDHPGLLAWDEYSAWLFWGSSHALAVHTCYPMTVDAGQDKCQGEKKLTFGAGSQPDAGITAELFKLATDGSHVYWREGLYVHGVPTSGAVRRIDKVGTQGSEVVADGETCLIPRWISLRGQHVYWTAPDGRVYRTSKTPGMPITAINDEPVPGLHSVVALDDAVYVTSWTSCALYRIGL